MQLLRGRGCVEGECHKKGQSARGQVDGGENRELIQIIYFHFYAE